MLINIIFGFFVPWIAGIYLGVKTPKTLLLIFPIGAVSSLVINSIGFQLKFWDFTPLIPNDESVSALPLDIGLYPLLACFMIWLINSRPILTVLILFLFILGTTLLEFMALIFGKVTYGNGWNIGYTFLSYLLAFGIVFIYFKLLKRNRLL